MLGQAMPLEVQTRWGGSPGSSAASLHLAVPKTCGPVTYVCMNGSPPLFGHQGTNKQVKIRLYADEMQLVNKDDVIKSM